MRIAVLSVHTSPLDQPGAGDGGGLNVYVTEVARHMAARGTTVDIFTRRTDPDQPDTVTVAPRLAIHHVDAGPAGPVPKDELPRHLSAFLLSLERRVSQPYDVVHAHYWLSGWVGRRLRDRWGVPLVQSFHTLAKVKNALLAPGDDPEPEDRLVGEALVVEAADRIVVPVCGEARLLHREYGLSGARITVVPPGVDLDVFHPGPAPAPDEAPPGDGPLLLFVGRLQPLKGPDVAIHTLAEVRRVVPDARLLIVGGTSGNGAGRSGPEELLTLADDVGVADAVAVAPARPQQALAELYRAATLVHVPSRSESFGLVALEAQACATPVVATDVGGLRATIQGGGTLVPGHDPGDHAAAVLAYLTDAERYRAASAAGARAARVATWDRTVDGLLAVYRDVVERPLLEAGA